MIDKLIRTGKTIAFCILAVTIILPLSISRANEVKLKVYISPGLDKPVAELATVFKKNNSIDVEIITGEINHEWVMKAQKAGDIIIAGAEYQLNQLVGSYPNLILKTSRTSLPPRISGILVRKGSNKKIASFSELSKKDNRLMVVDVDDQAGLWEDMTAKKENLEKIQKNIIVSAKSNSDALDQWKAKKDLDAWITFQSWHYYLKESTHLIKVLDHFKRFRGTPIAIIKSSKNKVQARQFMEFLKSKQNLQTFQKWGW